MVLLGCYRPSRLSVGTASTTGAGTTTVTATGSDAVTVTDAGDAVTDAGDAVTEIGMTECGSVGGGGRFWYQLHPTFYLSLYYLSGRREESFPTNRSNGNGEGREQRELVFRTSLRASYRRHLASSFVLGEGRWNPYSPGGWGRTLLAFSGAWGSASSVSTGCLVVSQGSSVATAWVFSTPVYDLFGLESFKHPCWGGACLSPGYLSRGDSFPREQLHEVQTGRVFHNPSPLAGGG